MEEQPPVTPRRIAVIGSPGGGKSTLATALASAMELPLIHLDREHWRPGWVEPDEADWRMRNARLVARDAWVIDGNYGSTLPLRLARAELAVWLDLPTRVCLAGALRRTWRFRRGGRPDMTEGCPERWDAEFLKFLAYIATFRRGQRPRLVQALSAGGVPVVRVCSVAERRALTRAVATGQGWARLASSRMEMP